MGKGRKMKEEEGGEREAFLTPLCSAPWDREHKQGEVDRTGERKVGMLTAAIFLSLTHTTMHVYSKKTHKNLHCLTPVRGQMYCMALFIIIC